MEKLPHIIPTQLDKFEIKLMAQNVYKIKHNKTSATIKLRSGDTNNPDIELVRIPASWGISFQKILGYVYENLIQEYKPVESRKGVNNRLFND